MKHSGYWIVSAAVLALISGCASTPNEKAAMALDCAWPDKPDTAAPSWVCDAPVDGFPVTAVGSFGKTNAGPQFAKEQATASGRRELAAQLKVHVQAQIKQYAETTGAGTTESVDMVNRSIANLITAETIEGSRILKSQTSPAGATYVLVGMDPQLVERKTQDAIRTSMRNEQALWQQFKAKQGHDEMSAEIAKLAGGNTQAATPAAGK